ncbi:MAG: carboxypeptidase regulatory-like domain-containing protein, partial [Candidatus Marinimicrobia bacterium]|nr:carboxypeptidase regulatory-like domain-containing protein [Candidatus Neomarinimicrobiota bacterium]
MSPQTAGIGSAIILTAVATDQDGDPLTYVWSASEGSFPQETVGMTVKWVAPNQIGSVTITLLVSDGIDLATRSANLQVAIITGNIEGYVYETAPAVSEKGTAQVPPNSNIELKKKMDPAIRLNKATSLPVDSVIVSVGNIETTSDGNGYWILNSVQTGRRVITAQRSGYGEYWDSLTVVEGTSTYDIYIKADVPDPPVSSVLGHIYYSGTTIPLPGALVSLGEISHTTGTSGFYRLDEVLTWQQTIIANKPGFDPYSQTIEVPSEGLSHDAYLTSTVYTSSIHGVVTNILSNNLVNAKIVILNPNSSESELWTTTDSDGYYALPTILQGTRTLSFSRVNYDTLIATIFLYDQELQYNARLTSSFIDPLLDLSVAPLSGRQMLLEWEPVSIPTAGGYNIYSSANPDGPYVRINAALIAPDNGNYRDAGLEFLTTYNYKLAVVNIDALQGPLSDHASATTFGMWSSNPDLAPRMGDTGGLSSPTLGDLDGDGDFDLLIAEINGAVIGIENVGSASSPSWLGNASLVSGIGDVGIRASPTLADLDGDGDLDLLIGLDGGTVIGYENVGTASSPSWLGNASLVSGIGNVGARASPTLADLDGDGDLDLLIGLDGGTVIGYENVGTASSPSWLGNASLVSGVGRVHSWNSPALADLDGDGDFDLMIGELRGIVIGYENVGSAYNHSWLGNANLVYGIGDVGSVSRPALADLDGDG